MPRNRMTNDRVIEAFLDEQVDASSHSTNLVSRSGRLTFKGTCLAQWKDSHLYINMTQYHEPGVAYLQSLVKNHAVNNFGKSIVTIVDKAVPKGTKVLVV